MARSYEYDACVSMNILINEEERRTLSRAASGRRNVPLINLADFQFWVREKRRKIGYPMLYWNAQAVVIGPHCGDTGPEVEWIDRKQYLDTIIAVTQMLRQLA